VINTHLPPYGLPQETTMDHKFKNLNDLKQQLETTFNGVVTVPMWTIRDAYGAERLGVNVVAHISEELEGRGIGHLPAQLPQNQWAMARVFLKNTPVGRVLKAAGDLDPAQDSTLRKLTNEKADDLLKRVRELVCD
jgi:hypothetical protein